MISKAQLSIKANTFSGCLPFPEVSKYGIHVGLIGLLCSPEDDLLGVDIKEFGKAKLDLSPVTSENL